MSVFSASEIKSYRELFPVTQNWVYLNHAGVAPISTRVWRAIETVGREALQQGFTVGAEWHARIETVRRQAAAFLNAEPDEIAFVKNTSHGLSLVARGLQLQAGDEVILSEVEFPTNVYPWMALEKQGVVIKKIPEKNFELQLDEFKNLITPRTRVISLSSVQYGSGFRLPLDALGKFCRERGIYFFADAIQSLGAFPLDVRASQVDFLSADAHKWLLGQEGIGILYVRRDLIPKLEPMLLGWNSVVDSFSFDRINFELPENARRFEEGSANTMAIAGMGAAFELLSEIGVARVAERILHLTDYLIAGLKKLGLEIANSLDPKYRSGIVAFRLPKADNLTVLPNLERHLFAQRIYVSLRRGSLRISPHFYNVETEIDHLLQVVAEFSEI